MSWTNAVGRRISRLFGGRATGVRKGIEGAGPTLGKDLLAITGKVDAEVKDLITQAERAFAKRRFAGAVSTYRDALAAFETPADAKAVIQSVSAHLDAYGQRAHLPWNKPAKVAASFAGILADARSVASYGDTPSIIRKSQEALASRDRKTFEDVYSYAKDLMTRIWFPFHRNGISPAKRGSLTSKVEESSWKLADHYAAVGHGDKAATFVASATAPTISRPDFERALREVKVYDAHGAMKDLTESQAWELALQARNLFRFGGHKVEDTQNALFEMLRLSLKYDSRMLPSEGVVAWLLNHARTPSEVGKLLERAQSLGYKVNVKRDILGAIKTPPLAGVTIDGTTAAVQAVNPTALVSFAEQHGFGAEATSTLVMALQGQRGGRHLDTPHISLGGLVADALNIGR